MPALILMLRCRGWSHLACVVKGVGFILLALVSNLTNEIVQINIFSGGWIDPVKLGHVLFEVILLFDYFFYCFSFL